MTVTRTGLPIAPPFILNSAAAVQGSSLPAVPSAVTCHGSHAGGRRRRSDMRLLLVCWTPPGPLSTNRWFGSPSLGGCGVRVHRGGPRVTVKNRVALVMADLIELHCHIQFGPARVNGHSLRSAASGRVRSAGAATATVTPRQRTTAAMLRVAIIRRSEASGREVPRKHSHNSGAAGMANPDRMTRFPKRVG